MTQSKQATDLPRFPSYATYPPRRCELCSNFHAAYRCRYTKLRALFGDLSREEESTLQWLSGCLDDMNEGTFLSLAGKLLPPPPPARKRKKKGAHPCPS
jgi:hypothetical protein